MHVYLKMLLMLNVMEFIEKQLIKCPDKLITSRIQDAADKLMTNNKTFVTQ